MNEQTLLPADNVLIGAPHQFGYALRHSVPWLIQSYVDELERVAVGFLVDQMAHRTVRVVNLPYRSLRLVEVYWEFADDDPVGLVERLAKPLYRLSRRISVNVASVSGYREDIECESRCVTITLAEDIRLRVYAKTTGRVRFEVEFKSKGVSAVCNSRTAGTTAEVGEKARQLVTRAMEEVNYVLSELRREVPAVVHQHTTMGLLTKVASIVTDPGLAQMVIASLHSYGRLAPERNPSILQVAHALKAAGVLKNIRGRSIYVPTEDYEAAARELIRM